MGKFGTLLKQLRRTAKQTLQDVADSLELSPSFVSDVEHGRRGPFDNEKIIVLAKQLNVDADGLLRAASADRKSIDLPVKKAETYNKLAFALLRADSDKLEDEETKRLMEQLISALGDTSNEHK